MRYIKDRIIQSGMETDDAVGGVLAMGCDVNNVDCHKSGDREIVDRGPLVNALTLHLQQYYNDEINLRRDMLELKNHAR